MSKLIKSTNAHQVNGAAKEIKLRSIHYLTDKPTEINKHNDSTDDKVHHLEQHYKKKEAEANQLLENAKTQVESWQKELQQYEQELKDEAERRFQDAMEKGERQGYAAGIQKGKEAYVSEIRKAQEIVMKAQEDYERRIEDSEPIMLQLAMEVAKKVIGNTLAEQDEAWLYLVKEAVKEVQGQEEIKVFVHPNWYETTLNHQGELKEIALNTRELYIFPSYEIEENSCYIETPFGRLEASVDSQLQELKRILLEKLREGEKDEA